MRKERRNHPSTPAHVILDSLASPLQDRHLLFLADSLDIHIKVVASGPSAEIVGQLIPHDQLNESYLVNLFVEKQRKQTTAASAFGEFQFQEVPTGDVAIEILGASRRILASFSA